VNIRELHEGWTVEPLDGPVPSPVRAHGPIAAAVPGVVHTDLVASGLLDDPYLGLNEKQQEWVGSTSWRYVTQFDWQPDGSARHDLRFAGLDTVATVILNGQTILSAENQHRSYRVPVLEALKPGANQLEVLFAAPVPEADRRSLELGYRPHVNHHPFNSIRKMACSYGWDWGIDTATSGIWKPLTLEGWSTARISNLVVLPAHDGTKGTASVRVTLDRASDEPITLRVTVGEYSEERQVEGSEADLSVVVPNAPLWWPRGYGEQPTSDLTVELRVGEKVLDSEHRRIGFRTVELDTTPDGEGTPFRIVVNGRPIAVKGVNWIPDDAFPGRITRDRVEQRLGQAASANINLLRVWGGGLFESDDFYDVADELGLLVWQDFLLACAAYSEDEPMRSEIEAEARENVARLGSHASLVVLNGNNENLWGYEDWGWQPRLEGKSWGALYYHELFPAIVDELAPHVGYTPGSPFTPGGATDPNDPDNGTMHIWDLWNQKDYPHYRDYRPRFVSEFGWQGPPTWSTLTESLSDAPLTPESPGMLVHQKAENGNVKLTDGLVAHLPLPNDMQDWHWAMSLNQAIAIRTGVEWFRSLQPHCMGTILWQLNDCWPVVSWAAIDGYGRQKPLWYAVKAAYEPRLLTIQPSDAGLVLAAVNDTAENWEMVAIIQRLGFDGTVLAGGDVHIDVPAFGAVTLPIQSTLSAASDVTSELLVVTGGEQRAFWWFAEARDSVLPAAGFDATATRVDGGVDVRVVAKTVIRDLAILSDIVDPDASADRMLISLLPGEEVVVRISTEWSGEASRFIDGDVLRSMNDLVKAR
jgi:beta-mannosidase